MKKSSQHLRKIVTGVWHSWEPDFGMAAAALLIAITWLVTDRVVVPLGRRRWGYVGVEE